MGLSRKARRAHRTTQSPGMLKMSEVLKDIAQPLLDELEHDADDDEYEMAFNLAAALWNAAIEPDAASREEAITTLKAAIDVEEVGEIDDLFHEVVERARTRYPGVRRRIAELEVTPLPDGRGYDLRVMSSA
jgi:hypothetical protein